MLSIGTEVFSFDPGETTGFVRARYDGGRVFTVTDALEFDWGDRFRIQQYMRLVTENGRTTTPIQVVYESFRLYKHKADDQINSDFPSSQVIGIIELAAYELGLYPERVTKQPASIKTNVQVLPQHADALRGPARGNDHVYDAYRHARYFILTHGER